MKLLFHIFSPTVRVYSVQRVCTLNNKKIKCKFNIYYYTRIKNLGKQCSDK